MIYLSNKFIIVA